MVGRTAPFAINSKKLGMWLFIVSDTLTFSALLLGLQLCRGWPIRTGRVRFRSIPAIAKSTTMTFVLLSSSLTMVLGVTAAHRNDRKQSRTLDAGPRPWRRDLRGPAHDANGSS